MAKAVAQNRAGNLHKAYELAREAERVDPLLTEAREQRAEIERTGVQILVQSEPIGLAFSGHYGDQATSRSIEGRAPARFFISPTATALSVVIQKGSGRGTLVVKIVRDGVELTKSNTSAGHGVVTLNHDLQ